MGTHFYSFINAYPFKLFSNIEIYTGMRIYKESVYDSCIISFRRLLLISIIRKQLSEQASYHQIK